MSQTTGVKNYEKINLHAQVVAPAPQRPKNATPEMFYKKGSEVEDDEHIISGIDEDLGESDVDAAPLEPMEKSKPKPIPVLVPEKKKVVPPP